MYAGNVVVGWSKHPNCKACGKPLNLQVLRVETFPYIHADLKLGCECGEEYLHGIPHRKDSGLALHIYDTNPADAVAYQTAQHHLKPRTCRNGHGDMLMTKIFGDWVLEGEQVEYQWKCEKCFLTHHEVHKRVFNHKEETLTDKERKLFKTRLQQMGYVQ